MGRYVNGLLDGPTSFDKITHALSVEQRQPPRGLIDQPTRSELQEQAQTQPQGAPEPAPQEAATPPAANGQAAPPPDVPVLADEPVGSAPVDPRSGAALPPPTAEEEKIARVMMTNITDLMYGDGLEQLTGLLKNGRPTPEIVGETTAMLISAELDAAEAVDKAVPPSILVSVGAEVVSKMYELAAALGVWSPDDEQQADKDMSTALNYAANLFVNNQVQTGRKDRLSGLAETMGDIQSGRYDSRPGQPMTNDMAPVGG